MATCAVRFCPLETAMAQSAILLAICEQGWPNVLRCLQTWRRDGPTWYTAGKFDVETTSRARLSLPCNEATVANGAMLFSHLEQRWPNLRYGSGCEGEMAQCAMLLADLKQ